MKAKVIKRFRDKNTGKIVKATSFYEADEKRIKELQGKGYLGEAEKAENPKLQGNVNQVKESLNGLDKEELSDLLVEERDNKGRKSVIEHIESLLAESK